MSEHTQNPNAPKAGAAHAARKLSCEEWEAMLADFLDGALPAGDVESFHDHRQSCASCAEMFSQAGQGRQWLNFLRMEPQVSPALVARILAQTSGAATPAGPGLEAASAVAAPIAVAPTLPFWQRRGLASVGRRVAQPRLLMTAAMAFFSITLTMNMAGVRLSAVRISDLRPATLAGNLDKQYHMASARVVRYYDNLRFVYEMEARVREIRRDSELNAAPAEQQPQPAAPATQPNGSSRKNGGKSEGPMHAQPQARLWGEKIEAALRSPAGGFQRDENQVGDAAPDGSAVREFAAQDSWEKPQNASGNVADQAERGKA